MKKHVMLCDIHEDRLAVERVTVSFLTRDKVQKDLCKDCYDEFEAMLNAWLGVTPRLKKVAAKKRTGRVSARIDRPKSKADAAPKRKRNTGMGKAILAYLAQNPKNFYTVEEVSTAIGFPRAPVGQALSQNAQRGKVKRVGKGQYMHQPVQQATLV